METTISLWKQLSHCRNNYLTGNEKSTRRISTYSQVLKRNIVTTISLWKQLSHCGNNYLTVETTISLWKQLSHWGNNYLTGETTISLETKNQLDVFLHTVKFWRGTSLQLSHCGNNFLTVETTISLWKQLSHCGNNYLTGNEKSTIRISTYSQVKCFVQVI
mgnify:CR=1 FL=1